MLTNKKDPKIFTNEQKFDSDIMCQLLLLALGKLGDTLKEHNVGYIKCLSS